MKKNHLTFFAVVLSCAVHAQNAGHSIEDEKLAGVADNISSPVTSSSSYVPFKALKCKLVGEKMKISPSEAIVGYFLTTADACGWGASLGPIWVVANVDGKYQLVLNAGGYSLNASALVSHGLYDLSVGSGTAAGSDSKQYKFNGHYYK